MGLVLSPVTSMNFISFTVTMPPDMLMKEYSRTISEPQKTQVHLGRLYKGVLSSTSDLFRSHTATVRRSVAGFRMSGRSIVPGQEQQRVKGSR